MFAPAVESQPATFPHLNQERLCQRSLIPTDS